MDVNNPNGIKPISMAEYLRDATIIKPRENVRLPWLDMLKSNADEVLYKGITQPLSEAGYTELGAGLAAIPSAINEFVLPSEASAWIPMLGSVTKLPTAAKSPVKNPKEVSNEQLRKAYDQGNFVLPDELAAERKIRAEASINPVSFVEKLQKKIDNFVPPKQQDVSLHRKATPDFINKFINNAKLGFSYHKQAVKSTHGDSVNLTNSDYINFLQNKLNSSEYLSLPKQERKELQKYIDDLENDYMDKGILGDSIPDQKKPNIYAE